MCAERVTESRSFERRIHCLIQYTMTYKDTVILFYLRMKIQNYNTYHASQSNQTQIEQVNYVNCETHRVHEWVKKWEAEPKQGVWYTAIPTRSLAMVRFTERENEETHDYRYDDLAEGCGLRR